MCDKEREIHTHRWKKIFTLGDFSELKRTLTLIVLGGGHVTQRLLKSARVCTIITLL